MNNSLKMLFDEHEVISNVIETSKYAASLIGKDDKKYARILRELITFFRSFADNYHHYKEELILFPEIAKKNETAAASIVREMNENHEEFRELIRSVEKEAALKNYTAAQKKLEQYGEALLYHIAVENEELFQMAETLFTSEELKTMQYRFEDCDRELGEKTKKELVDLTESLRKELTDTVLLA
jgi:hemerythrin-like domain-containing protein